MSSLVFLVPLALLLGGAALGGFLWSLRSGQYDDLDSPAHSILFDDEDPAHRAGIDEAEGTITDKPEQATPRD